MFVGRRQVGRSNRISGSLGFCAVGVGRSGYQLAFQRSEACQLFSGGVSSDTCSSCKHCTCWFGQLIIWALSGNFGICLQSAFFSIVACCPFGHWSQLVFFCTNIDMHSCLVSRQVGRSNNVSGSSGFPKVEVRR